MESQPRRSPGRKTAHRQLWKINVGIGHSAVSVVGNRAYTMGNANDTDTVFSIDVATGKVVWTHSYPCNEKVGIKDYDGPLRRRLSRAAWSTRSAGKATSLP